MEDENEYKKLPTDEKCVHKLWKARVAGYEEATKLFNQIDDEKSQEWNKYLGLIKKFVTDSNAVAQEKGLEAALVFVENCGHAGKVTGEVMAGIVTKCIAAPKTKTKDLALQITLMFVEIEKQEAVQEELMKGMEHKNPKISCACIVATIAALKQFGNKVVSIKPLVKKIPIMLADRDKDVRSEGKNLVVEMHRWIGGAIEPHIASLQPVVQQELREAFTAAGTGARPSRYLRSQQQRQEAAVVEQDVEGNEDENDCEQGGGDSADMDPYDLLDPVEIISRLPKDFYDKLEAKKWQERKEALESLETLLKSALKLESGDYGDLLRALKKVVGKDSNVVLVAMAGRCMAQIATGLRTKFQPYAVSCMSTILEKFKEKKPAVVTALRDAADAIYPSTNLEALMEDMGEAFKNKNPSVKTESALFLARALCRTQPAALTKKLLKFYVADLLKLLESADPAVRDASAEALGTAMKLVSEKNIAPHIGKLEPLKEQKIKEFCDKAVIQVKTAAPKKKAPAAKGDAPAKAGSTQARPVKRPATAVGAKKTGLVKKMPAGASKGGTKSASIPAREQELSPEEVDEKAEEIFGAQLITEMADANWKTRLAAVQTFTSRVQGLSSEEVSAQVLLRTVNKKPGLKDTNIQVLKGRLEVVKLIVETFDVFVTSAEFVIEEVTEKLGDAKCSALAAETLTSLAEATRLENIALAALDYAMDKQKSPKVQAETFTWLAAAMKEFGLSMNVKLLVPYLKKGVSAINPAVRTSCISLAGVLSLYTGPTLMAHFDSEKTVLKQQIQAEMDKYANEKPPTPSRGVSKSASKASIGEDLDEEPAEDDLGEDESTGGPVQDTAAAPRTDITTLVTDALINEINDKNWKVRNEGLEKLKSIIATSAPIKASLGELPPALAARLLDSNSKIAQTTLQILGQLATAMGPKCKIHIRTFFPGFFQALGDSKAWVRSASSACLGAWCAAAGGAGAALEGEMVLDALKGGSPALRAELLQWLADNLPAVPAKSFPKEELTLCLPLLYSCLEDRSADVRRTSAEAMYGFMLHLTYETMHKQLEKVKPGSKPVVQAALDKVRPNMPIQPLPSAKGKKDDKTVKSGGAQKKDGDKKVIPTGKAKGIVKPSSAKAKKEEEESCMPLLPINNAKNQRIIDDQKLKVLKWNFTVPREEFFDLLKDQMSSAGLNKQLISNMFHADFRYHLKAIESLSEDLSEGGQSLMCNLDLVLKWLTLRFFDTNPSVLLKGLEYLSSVFTVLIGEQYTMAEYEANCFIPYLVLKVGDPKDTVRNGVKALFKQICVVYSVTKLFGYLMEGLKSKNARQRTECLDCIGHLLECYGSCVCAPSTASALKELARHIGDRDNSVRSAALNCISNAYFLEGEKVYKMIGQISDKDLSLLEERIKRAAKTRSAENRKSTLLPLTATGKQMMREPSDLSTEEQEKPPTNQISVEQSPGCYDEAEDEPEPAVLAPSSNLKKNLNVMKVLPTICGMASKIGRSQGEGLNIAGINTQTQLVAPQPSVIPGPYGLDPELMARLDAEKPNFKKVACQEMDLRFMDESTNLPSIRPSMPVNNIRSSMLPMSPPSRITSSSLEQNSGPGSYLPPAQGLGVESTMLTDVIHSIASPNLKVAMAAMSHINEVLTSGRDAALATHEEALLLAVAAQVRRLRSNPTPDHDTYTTYKYLTAMLNTLYDTSGAGSSVSSAALGSVLSELLLVLASRSLEHATDGERLVRAANTVCVRVLCRSDHTALLTALMTLLHESIGEESAYPRYQELLMKCVWKALKMISSWEVDSINYDILMQKVHHFYKTYPNAYWKKNTNLNDTPNRTVKTLVHTLVKLKGTAIMNHLTLIPNVQESELHAYLIKLFKHIKLDENKKENVPVSVPQSQAPHTDLPRPVHEELQRILTRIGDKKHCQEALVQLYDLRERHPNVDIWVYLKGSSMIFRNYIERGLRDVAEERRAGRNYAPNFASIHANSDVNTNDADGEPDEGDERKHTFYRDRLRALQAAAGMRVDSSQAQASVVRSPVIDNKTLSDTLGQAEQQPRHNIDPQFDLHTIQPLSQRNTEAGVDALRQKLQQIKSSLNR